MLEIPLDKELTANCLVETCTKVEELILAVMVKYGLNRMQLPLWLQESLINDHLMVWFVLGPSVQRGCIKLQSRGQNAPKITCGGSYNEP